MKKWAIDTNILVYLLDGDSPFQPVIKDFLQYAASHDIQLVIAQQNILELINVLRKYYHCPFAVIQHRVQKILELIDEVIIPSSASLNECIELCQNQNSFKNQYDAYLIATLASQVDEIITADQKFIETPLLKSRQLASFQLA